MSYNNCCNKNVKRNQLSSHGQSLPRPRSIIVSSIAVVDPGNLSSSSSGLTVVATGEGNTRWREFEAFSMATGTGDLCPVNGSSTPGQPGSSDKQFEFRE